MNYGWGAVGHDSLVAVLASISRGEKILADAPYAELWVGADATAPALVAEPHRRVEFSAWIERRYRDGSLAETSRWTAILGIAVQPPTNADALRRNPLGIFVTSINWSKELG